MKTLKYLKARRTCWSCSLLPVTLCLALCLLLSCLAVPPAYADDPTFPGKRKFGTGSDRTYSVTVGDVDGDGDLDIITGNRSEQNTVYLNDGGIQGGTPGNFSTGRDFGTGSDSTRSVAVGDVDGDGDLDIITGNDGEQNVVYLNDGGVQGGTPGNFSTGRNFGTGSDETYSVAVGDVDGDGDLDIIAGNDEEQNVVYLNDGGVQGGVPGYFSTSRSFGTGLDRTWGVAVADIDSDGDLDIIAGDYAGQNAVYLNDGGVQGGTPGHFLTSHSFGTGWYPTTSVAVGDMDGDSDMDIITGNWSKQNIIYLNDGAGHFLTSRDFGTGSDWTYSVAVADVDSDSDLDIVAGNYLQQNAVYLNDGGVQGGVPGHFSTGHDFGTGSDWTRIVGVGDMDSDGNLDLVTGNSTRQNVVYLNDGAGYLPASQDFGTGSDTTHSVTVADIDNDGDLDIVAGNYLQQNAVYLNDGGIQGGTPGNFLSSYPFGTGADDIYSLAVGDVDGDDDLDLVLGNGLRRNNAVYLNDGGIQGGTPGRFSITYTLGAEPENTRWVTMGDVDGDDDLDIVVANNGEQNVVYLNDGGVQAGTPGTFSITRTFGTGSDKTYSLAIGDVDGDGDLDLVAGNYSQQNVVYLNDGVGVFPITRTFGTGSDNTYSVAVGDMDGDGNLDIIAGNHSQQNAVYLNDGGFQNFSTSRDFGTGSDNTWCVAVGDMDGDGDLDIAAGNRGELNTVSLNDGGVQGGTYGVFPTSRDFGTGSDRTYSLAVGDMDGDGDLDLVAGNSGTYGEQNVVFLSAGRVAGPVNSNPFLAFSRPLATGDANFYSSPQLLDSLTIPITYTLFDYEGDPVGRVEAFYSPDGGGRWLPAIATTDTHTSNLGTGYFTSTASPLTITDNGTINSSLNFNISDQVAHRLAVALTISHSQSSQLAAALHTPWPSPTGTSVLLFDRVGGNSPGFANLTLSDWANRSITTAAGSIYTTTGTVPVGGIVYTSTDVPTSIPTTTAIVTSTLVITGGPLLIADVNVSLHGTYANGDLDFELRSPASMTVKIGRLCSGEGDFDLTLDDEVPPGDWPCPPSDGGTYRPSEPLSAFDGEDSNGTWTLIVNNRTGGDGGSLEGWELLINSTFTITTRTLPISGAYRPAEPLAQLGGAPLDTPFTLIITDTVSDEEGVLESWSLRSTGADHVYTWDTFASGFFGQSDNVTLRFVAFPQPVTHPLSGTYQYPNRVPGPYQWPYASAATFPFRVRGTQVRVLSDTLPVASALVYRMPAGQGTRAEPLSDKAGQPFRTDAQGYLQGRGQIDIGDHLVALLPITYTDSYTLYYASATPTLIGLDAHVVAAPGVQTLTVSANNPLVLFNLDVSLQWDARYDDQFMSQLEFDLQRASETLYDWMNGQAALGRVRVYHDRQRWNEAHIRIYATNRLRPRAAQGGIISGTITEVITSPALSAAEGTTITMTYALGQVHMGAVWNRYGDPGSSLGEDWPRTLAHELGHYALFLEDNYLGMNADGVLIPVEGCPGAMSDPYREDYPYDEFHPDEGWLPACEWTLSNRTTGRSDWATITRFYPWLNGPSPEPTNDSWITNPGPSSLALAVTQIKAIEPATPCTALEEPTFYLSQEGQRVQPGAGARAFLFQSDRAGQDGRWLADLGRPTLDRVLARGAQPGDRLCVYEPDTGRLGCETISPDDEQLELVTMPGWQPDLIISPTNSRTIALTVTNVPTTGVSLKARLFPLSAPASGTISLTLAANGYAGIFTTTEPALDGYVQVWVDEAEPRREIVTDYSLSGSPGMSRGHSGMSRGHSAPAVSADGQVILFGENLEFGEGEFFTLQAATAIPSPPPWATVVGQTYRLSASANAPDLSRASVSFTYMGDEVPPGEEVWLQLYFWDGAEWHRLSTSLDSYHNIASTPAQREGLYALMSSLEIPLYSPGWNLFSYPVQATRPVTEALLSISGYYTTVYGYTVQDRQDPWKVYDVTVDNWVNDLPAMEYGQGYWINVSQAITMHLKGGSTPTLSALASFPFPPTTYYGPVLSSAYFAPTTGMAVTAWVDTSLCGRGRTLEVEGQIVYIVDVLADDGGNAAGCGMPGRSVTFRVGTQNIGVVARWDNSRLWKLPLRPNAPPSAAGDTANTPKETPVSINVLANDTDPDIGDSLTINQVGTPANGMASTDGDTVTYTPALNFIGTDVFAYTVTDGFLTDTASVTVTVTALSITKTVEVGSRPEVSLGGVVTYTLILSNSSGGPVSGVVMTDRLPSGLSFGRWVITGSAQLPPPGHTITWGPWEVPAGTAYTLRFTAIVTDDNAFAGAAITNTAYLNYASQRQSAEASFTIEKRKRVIYLPIVIKNH